MRVDLKTIKWHCYGTGCGDCALDNGGCMFRVPPEQWRVDAIERRYKEIVTSKAREAMDGRTAE